MKLTITHRPSYKVILFSDLHYSHETKDTCFEVLRFIHKKALEINAKIYFLGDFWDHVYRRGTLPVDLLNEMVRFFSSEWRVFTTMIPGNHDYFDSAEEEHGLEMFKQFHHIHVLDSATVLDGVLFLPYRKKPDNIRNSIAETSEVNTIVGHLDIIGAKMNNTRKSTKGCSKDMFTVPTYSGHYHTPSVHGNVRYIGSPYQVHLGEAEDKKHLCVINYKTGELVDQIPIDIGRHHYKVKHLSNPDQYKKGDRVIVEETFLEEDVSDLEKRGSVFVLITLP